MAIITSATPLCCSSHLYKNKIISASCSKAPDSLKSDILGRWSSRASTVQNAPFGIIVIDSQAHVLSWNPMATKIFGWHSDEVLDSHIPFTKKRELRKLPIHDKVISSFYFVSFKVL